MKLLLSKVSWFKKKNAISNSGISNFGVFRWPDVTMVSTLLPSNVYIGHVQPHNATNRGLVANVNSAGAATFGRISDHSTSLTPKHLYGISRVTPTLRWRCWQECHTNDTNPFDPVRWVVPINRSALRHGPLLTGSHSGNTSAADLPATSRALWIRAANVTEDVEFGCIHGKDNFKNR